MNLVRTSRRKLSKQGGRLIVGIPGELAEDLGITEEHSADWHKVLDEDGKLIPDRAVLIFTKNGESEGGSESD